MTVWRPGNLPRNVPLYIFGVGQGGLALGRWAGRQSALHVAGFIDNHKSGHARGVPIFSLDAFRERCEPDAVVLIASQYVKEIGKQLQAAGVERWSNAHPCAIYLIDRERAVKGRVIILAGLLLAGSILGWAAF